EDYGFFFLNVQLPPAASLERTDEACRHIESILAGTPGVDTAATVAGFSLLTRVSSSNSAFYFVRLKPWEDRGAGALHARAIVDRLNGALAKQVPEAIAFGFMPPSIPGLGNSGGFSFWLQDRSGGSPEFLDAQLQAFLAAARKRPELAGVTSLYSSSVPQLYADVDQDRALQQGVAGGDVYQTLQTFLGGLAVSEVHRSGRQG